MSDSYPILYISILLGLLSFVAIFLFREIIKSRRTESRYSKLQEKLKKQKGTAQEYYELAGIFLDKKLFVQAVNLLQKGLKAEKDLGDENKALMYNALGYAYFSQEQYDIAIRNYKEAVKLCPGYTVALNNLGNVYEKKQLMAKALESYKQALESEPKNKVAKKRVESLEKRVVIS